MDKNKEKPIISIIIPVYKVEQYLTRCVESILNQTFQNFECILIDDGSPDNCSLICEEFAKKDSRISVMHKLNEGVSVARNVGINNSLGEWITFVDGDDWLESTMLEDLYETAINNSVEIVISGYYLATDIAKVKEIIPNNGLLTMPEDFSSKWQAPWGKLYKKSLILRENVSFPKGITLAEDLFFTFNLFYSTGKIWGVDKPLYNYYQNRKSVCHDITIDKINDEKYVLQFMEKKLANDTSEVWKDFLNNRKLMLKNKYIFSLNEPEYDLWNNYYFEITKKEILKFSPLSYKPVLFFVCNKKIFIANIFLFIWRKLKRIKNV